MCLILTAPVSNGTGVHCILRLLALTSSNEACHQLHSGQSCASPERHVTPSTAIYLLQI